MNNEEIKELYEVIGRLLVEKRRLEMTLEGETDKADYYMNLYNRENSTVYNIENELENELEKLKKAEKTGAVK